MIRRTRRPREIPFSFDSFLDVVANVVGIIIRLILVVWVGARSYSSVKTLVLPESVNSASVEVGTSQDPLEFELALHRQELARARDNLLDQLKDLEQSKKSRQEVAGQLVTLTAATQVVAQERSGLERAALEREQDRRGVELSLAELRQRRQKLAEEIRAVEKLPPLKQVLRYRTPVSRLVESEEIFFECQRGRVAFIDIATLLADVRRSARARAEDLNHQWQVSAQTASVGTFRLRYTLERERGLIDAMIDTSPEARADFRYGLSSWVVEPLTWERGEDVTDALAEGSQFRQVVDALDPQHAVVTFWVYPDSFDLYRRLRDYLYDRDMVVAGRPLPEGYPIACSKKGSLSRGQ